MKLLDLPLTTALALALLALPAIAETRAPASPTGASAPTAVRPGPRPRLMSPAEMNENASPPGELRPENPVTPQIVIPLRNPLDVPPTDKRSRVGVKPAARGNVNDAVARCEALPDAAARAACRNKIEPGAR